MASPTADWERVGDRFYRKVKLYDAVFDQDLELENYVIAGAPYGGAIDGSVRCYFDLQGDFTQFSLGNGAEEHGVTSCRFWSTGFVAMLSNNHLIAVSHYIEPRPKLLAIPPDGTVYSWSLIPPAYTLSRSVEVLLAMDKTIYVVDTSDAEDRILQDGPFKHVSVSPNGRFVTLYTEDGKVWVISSDFQKKLSEYDSKAKTVPKDVQWCGNNSVVLAWEDEVHMVGPNGAALKYYYDGWVHLLADIDGVRLITNDVCEFLQKVPEDTEEVFKLGSTAPASVLLDAVDQLEKKSPKADDNIKLIRSNLDEAIDMCIRAAGHEYSSHWQKQLLKAASFGKSVLDLYNSDDFVNMCETLRVLSAVRDYRIGLPLSYDQFLRLTPGNLIQRLINRQEYLLAIRVSEYLRLPTDKIYVHWATQKVRTSTADEDTICAAVVAKLASKRGVSFDAIARAAYDEGRAHLATQLLNHEPRAGKQVPLLLSMEEDTLALDKAIESGDTDLIFFVLLHLKSKIPLASFFRLLSTRPLASALVESSAAANDAPLLKDLYYQDDRLLPSSNLLLSAALAQPTTPQKLDKLKLAAKTLADSKDPAALFHQRALADAQSLLRVQDALSRDLDATYTGLSLNATLHTLIRTGYAKRALKIQSDFHLSEKSFAWIRLRALVAARNWGELEELSKARKSVVGWEPYFNAVLGAGNTKLAGVFVGKCTGLTAQERSEMWVKCGMVGKAGEELVKVKDVEGLERLKEKAAERGVVLELERLIKTLRPKR
ncbi:hypothetical protein MMC18_007681 [Xylographa bjoerkii]|nr:hypothetical protein [Xylographa bjoerkii]